MKYKENGAVFEGWWMNGMRHGLGRIIYANQEMYYGLWVDDDKFSGLHVFRDGSTFCTGNWSNEHNQYKG